MQTIFGIIIPIVVLTILIMGIVIIPLANAAAALTAVKRLATQRGCFTSGPRDACAATGNTRALARPGIGAGAMAGETQATASNRAPQERAIGEPPTQAAR
jgi:hypothetical protein